METFERREEQDIRIMGALTEKKEEPSILKRGKKENKISKKSDIQKIALKIT